MRHVKWAIKKGQDGIDHCIEIVHHLKFRTYYIDKFFYAFIIASIVPANEFFFLFFISSLKIIFFFSFINANLVFFLLLFKRFVALLYRAKSIYGGKIYKRQLVMCATGKREKFYRWIWCEIVERVALVVSVARSHYALDAILRVYSPHASGTDFSSDFFPWKIYVDTYTKAIIIIIRNNGKRKRKGTLGHLAQNYSGV